MEYRTKAAIKIIARLTKAFSRRPLVSKYLRKSVKRKRPLLAGSSLFRTSLQLFALIP